MNVFYLPTCLATGSSRLFYHTAFLIWKMTAKSASLRTPIKLSLFFSRISSSSFHSGLASYLVTMHCLYHQGFVTTMCAYCGYLGYLFIIFAFPFLQGENGQTVRFCQAETIAEVMSTFTACGDLSLLFKATWRIYLWKYTHDPCLRLPFDLRTNQYML